MRGAAMKIGQELSMEGADILPAEFTRALAILRDSADTMPDSQVRRVMGRILGRAGKSSSSNLISNRWPLPRSDRSTVY